MNILPKSYGYNQARRPHKSLSIDYHQPMIEVVICIIVSLLSINKWIDKKNLSELTY